MDNVYVKIISIAKKLDSDNHGDDYRRICRSPHYPLLLDYDWVYKNVEWLFAYGESDYKNYQSIDEVLVFFKALTSKYSLEEEYIKLLSLEHSSFLMSIWGLFAENLVAFLAPFLCEENIELLEKSGFFEYFLRYQGLYNFDILESFGIGLKYFLNQERFAFYLKRDFETIIKLIKNKFKISIPLNVMLDKHVNAQAARTFDFEQFYYYLIFVEEQCCPYDYIEEHKRFCDNQIKQIEGGILSILQKEYDEAPKLIYLKKGYHLAGGFKSQVIERIFSLADTEFLPKKYFFQELSKYIIFGMFLSRNFETSPYNIMKDIETLYRFAKAHNRKLLGYKIYEFCVNFESKSVFDIIELYLKTLKYPLKEMLYDDWAFQKNAFVDEINSRILNVESLEKNVDENGVEYYDITNVEDPILVHRTSVSIYDEERIKSMYDKIMQGNKEYICLSLQDKEHQRYFEENNLSTIKFMYGKLDTERVGMFSPFDAYSYAAQYGELNECRMLYTLEEFLKETSDFNEITYSISSVPYLPIGVICESFISEEEAKVAEMFNVPIFLRKSRDITRKLSTNNNKKRFYNYQPYRMTLFD